MKGYLMVVSILLGIISCKNEVTESSDNVRVAFYNVENLFDTKDDPKINDQEFLPNSEKKWDDKKYKTKINAIANVIIELGDGNGPDLIGLCEIENADVLEDLINSETLASLGYAFEHFNSPDGRGIDVALIYKKALFQPTASESHRIRFPSEPNSKTRDFLFVSGTFNSGEDKLNIFVNHFPSRREGLKKSEPRRVYVASQVRKEIDKLIAENPDANVVVMGDFNDEPFNKSIKEVLGAKQSRGNVKEKDLFNAMAALEKDGQGSYNFRGNWNMLDQIMVSASMLDDDGFKLKEGSATILKESWLLQGRDAGKYAGNPDRTYAGHRYLGGESDHLPVYIDLVK